MDNTVVGVFDSYAQAQSAMNELIASGFSRTDVQLNPDQETSASSTTTTDNTSDSGGIGGFFRSLFGMDDQVGDRDTYAEAVRRGSCVLTVNADNDEQRDRAIDIMNRYDPVDLDERSTHWRNSGWTGYDASAPRLTDDEIVQERSRYSTTGTTGTTGITGTTGATSTAANLTDTTRTEGSQTIPVIQEELAVGKRQVQRGGVRVYQRVRETPVTESVQLRDETIHVERHKVDQPASQADLAAFKEGAIELRETDEEAVVGKSARVVEEVVVGKDVTQRTEQIQDTVRRTDVEVEQLGAGTTRTAGMTDDSDFRTHWQTAYGQQGGRYEDYDAAYRYGSSLSSRDRFQADRWNEVEPQVRSEWESNNPGSAWDKVKDAVRYGAQRVTNNQQRNH
ncbi:YsnF/AvaK domain-containing protein [Noviherbaspirillum sp.]|uniref:YsnF/AvaK domain-containing protein n=1 Tax=Noviherbaspirillum sp. TaxID=1926288 RepID=UPI002FDF5B06